MGKGDKKTRRGKIVNKSSGKRRQRKSSATKPKSKKVVSKVKATQKSEPKPTAQAGTVDAKPKITEKKVPKPKTAKKE